MKKIKLTSEEIVSLEEMLTAFLEHYQDHLQAYKKPQWTTKAISQTWVKNWQQIERV